MRRWMLFLLLLCLTPCALAQQSLPPSRLSDDEIRQLLRQLNELEQLRALTAAQATFAVDCQAQRELEKANYARAVDLEKQATGLAQKETGLAMRERDLERERAAFYEAAFKSVTKKPGIGCLLKRIFTLGLARCR